MISQLIESCKKCPLSKKCVPLAGYNADNIKPRIGVILTSPSKEAVQQGESFEGVVGAYLTKILHKADISQSDVFVSYLVHCSVRDVEPDLSTIKTCSPWLDKKIELSNPKVLIACGQQTVKHLLNIPKKTVALKDYVGNDYPYGNFYTKVIPAYSIPYCLRRGWPTEQQMIKIFKKGKELAW